MEIRGFYTINRNFSSKKQPPIPFNVQTLHILIETSQALYMIIKYRNKTRYKLTVLSCFVLFSYIVRLQNSIYQSLFLCFVILNVYFSTLVLHSVLSYAVSFCLKKYLFIPLTVLITSTLHARSKYISGSGNLGNFVCFYKNQPRK